MLTQNVNKPSHNCRTDAMAVDSSEVTKGAHTVCAEHKGDPRMITDLQGKSVRICRAGPGRAGHGVDEKNLEDGRGYFGARSCNGLWNGTDGGVGL
jgi:hypothetical protein